MAEREKSRAAKNTSKAAADDDFFNLSTSRNGRMSDDEMDVDSRPTTKGISGPARRKRLVADEEEEAEERDSPPAKKPRRAPAKTSSAAASARGAGKKTAVVSRESSVASNAPPTRKAPSRAAATRARKVSFARFRIDIQAVSESDEEGEENVIELSDEEDDFQTPPPRPSYSSPSRCD